MKTATSKISTLALCAVVFGLSLLTASAATDVSTGTVTLRDFKLAGDLSADNAAFTLTATAHVDGAHGASLDLLAGPVALTDVGPHPRWHVGVKDNHFVLYFDRHGDFPIQLKFSAAVRQTDGWNAVVFSVAPATLQPIELRGLAADTRFQFAGAARPDRANGVFQSYLPSDGSVNLAWKEAPKEEEGKLFYSVEMLSQISVSPGLMRQAALLDFKVMQGELSRVSLRLHGAGEVTRVTGDQVLAWNVEAISNSPDHLLIVQLNQAQKDQFSIQVQIQSPIGAFPQTVDAMQVRPEGGTRFAGFFRIVNDGAVRLEVAQAAGLSQISPEQFPDTDASRALFHETGEQRFAYRFSGADFALRIQADQILPELSVSQVLSYHLGESELAVDADIELDIREAPLRELLLRVPKGYAIAKLTAGDNLSDSFVRELAGEPDAELRLVFGQPVSGRQVINLRLEHNAGLGTNNWSLPRIEVTRAKSVRGHVGVAADAGFRLTPERTQALTEIATAFFPAKVPGLQAAFRMSDPAWAAVVHVERLPQTVQADVLHLFSIGEGIAYGSSVINYVITGAPVSVFKVELSDEYFNVEFTGQDVRSWQKTAGGYLVSLHTPISGAYTLLATYERPFKPEGETLAFTGARPLDAQSEQGYTLVISTYQFQVKAADISPGLLALETGEVPPEYRLFFDAPLLAAYRYSSRPFNLKLALSPLAQGDSLSQVVDRASITNRISKEGQVLTDVRYYLKNRGNTHFRLTLPMGTDLWSATVNGAAVVPVSDGNASLIPLPQSADPNAVLTVDLKLAARSPDARHLTLAAPIAGAPVMLEEWQIEPDAGQRLVFKKGTLTPVGGIMDASGFAGLARVFHGPDAARAEFFLGAMVVLVGIAVMVWRRSAWEAASGTGARLIAGILGGAVAFALAVMALVTVAGIAGNVRTIVPADLTFLAPVQQAGSALSVEVANLPEKISVFEFISHAWPALLALVAWAFARMTNRPGRAFAGSIAGWTLVAWSALRFPNGAPAFFIVVVLFLALHLALPAMRRLWQLRRSVTVSAPHLTAEGGPAPAITMLLAAGLIWLAAGHAAMAAETPVLAESVTQQVRIEENFALATAKIRWQAAKGDTLPLLVEPAVLTHANYPARGLKLVQAWVAGRRIEQLVAQIGGTFDIELQYQLQLAGTTGEGAFMLPTPFGLINEMRLTLSGLDVDVFSPQAVSVKRNSDGSNTVATLVLSPLANATIGWKPRSRDVKREKPVFYAETYQLYAPSAGVVEGLHYAVIKPAQGELSELVFDVPAGATITDVIDPSVAQVKNVANQAATEPLVSLWRFDPDTRRLRVNLRTAQPRTFVLAIRSQVASGTLPFEQRVGMVSVENAAGQIGLLGVATGNEVQLDAVNVDTNGFSPINLEDFPGGLAASLQGQIPGLTVRRAYRYADATASASLKASAVEPDVRVETEETLSLGEDRTGMAVNSTVDITHAGIFKLSFLLPAGMDVESVSGEQLSHWTESKSEEGRVITLHLRGKTEGHQQFAISLAGPGVKTALGWTAPQLVFREAGKQRGTLVVAPEQGMRLQVTTRDGITQLDPQKSGIKQKGVLAFRILQSPWSLALDIEQVDPWIQVTSLQHATVSEAQVKVAANLQYDIENTGLKSLRVYVPTNAEGVHFQGDQLSVFQQVDGAITNGLQEWEVKLDRRVIGAYLLQLTYQVLMPDQASETTLRGVQAADVNLQRGFVAVQSGGRIEVRVDAPPAALQPAEWQSIPRALQRDLQEAPANFAYRLVEPSFELPLKLERHQAAKLLAARVQSVTFTSVISDDGIMLTQAHLEMIPGDKRLLNLTLPAGAHFWFAFVNQNGVWPWKEQDRILIPLDQQSHDGQPVPVEFFFTSRAGDADGKSLRLDLLGPKFDLPLENITWRVHLNDKWKVTRWTGSMQLQDETVVPAEALNDPQTYLQYEAGANREKTKQAESMLAMGNSFLANGDPQQARRAFQSAYGLSRGDDAFNEDTRVQLNNLKLQQALVGLNVRQAEAGGGDAGVLGGNFHDLRNRKEVAYTQQDAKDIIDRNTADGNAAFMKLAQRLIQQQDAAVSSPATIRADIPESGRVLTFHRAVLVDQWADLNIGLKAAAAGAVAWGARFFMLTGVFLVLALAAWAASPLRRSTV
jgi:hypothetical protein